MESLLEKNLKLNSIQGSWYLKDGMGFGDGNLFWGEKKKRIVPHEGIDLGFIKTDAGIINVPKDFKIHNFIEGEIIRIIDDFIGKSVFIRHSVKLDGKDLYSIYGHTDTNISEGRISQFEILGRIAEKNNIPRHYHYSLCRIPENIDIKNLNWKFINEDKDVNFINPLKYKCQEDK